MSELVNDINQIVYVENELKQVENFYDNWGFSLYMAVLKPNMIVLSSKHWLKDCYIEIDITTNPKILDQFVFGLWDIITQTSTTIKRSLERNNKVKSYVYITQLNREQTLKVYNELINELYSRKLQFDIFEKWNLFGWEVNDENAQKIPWVTNGD